MRLQAKPPVQAVNHEINYSTEDGIDQDVPLYMLNTINKMASFIEDNTEQGSLLTQKMLVTSPESFIGLTREGRTVRWMKDSQSLFGHIVGHFGIILGHFAPCIKPLTECTVVNLASRYVNPAIIYSGIFLYDNYNTVLNNSLSENIKLVIKYAIKCIAYQYIDPIIASIGIFIIEELIKRVFYPEDVTTDSLQDVIAKHAAQEPSPSVQNIIAKCAIVGATIGLGAGVIVSVIVVPPLAGGVNLIAYMARKWRPGTIDSPAAGNGIAGPALERFIQKIHTNASDLKMDDSF